MAKQQGKVYLGYEEDVVSEKNQTLLSYTVNKIGGRPDWPPLVNINLPSKCPHCNLHRVLIVQCYAPLEGSIYHRTLYVFACLSPNCWNQSDSWVCLRVQYEDNISKASSTTVAIPSEANMTWCSNADDWDENDNGDTANGNFMSVDNDNAHCAHNAMQRHSDEDDESSSYDLETVEQALGNLQMFDAHNANMSPVQDKLGTKCKSCESPKYSYIAPPMQKKFQGAVGAIMAPAAAAELEGGDEPGLVTVDSPIAPTNDVHNLLYQSAELPIDLRNRLACAPLQFIPKFIYVEEEWSTSAFTDDRVNELLNKYTKENALEIEASASERGCGEEEQYEEAAPAHGDRLFHAFLTRLRHHPGQILRYSRSERPLLGAPLQPPPPAAHCSRCGSTLICELQLVPELCLALRLPGSVQLSHLHLLSVLVFTCAQSCWQPTDTALYETVVFQPEVI